MVLALIWFFLSIIHKQEHYLLSSYTEIEISLSTDNQIQDEPPQVRDPYMMQPKQDGSKKKKNPHKKNPHTTTYEKSEIILHLSFYICTYREQHILWSYMHFQNFESIHQQSRFVDYSDTEYNTKCQILIICCGKLLFSYYKLMINMLCPICLLCSESHQSKCKLLNKTS